MQMFGYLKKKILSFLDFSKNICWKNSMRLRFTVSESIKTKYDNF